MRLKIQQSWSAARAKGAGCFLGALGLLLVVGLFLPGCAHVKMPHDSWRPAERTADGSSLVLLRLRMGREHTTGTQEVVLNGAWDYGLVTLYEPPNEAYYLYDRKAGKYYGTRDFAHFLDVLRVMPREVEIERLDSCTASWARTMPEGNRRQLDQVVEARGIHLTGTADWATIVCRCQVAEMIFPPPEDADRPLVLRE